MKLPMIIAAASLAMLPAFASAQDEGDQVGGAPLEGGVAQNPVPVGDPIPAELIVGGVLAAGAAVGIGLALGGGGDGAGAAATTSTTSTVSTTGTSP